MEEQKQAVMEFVKEQKAKGYTVTDALNDINIKRSTYYSWTRPKRKRSLTSKTGELTPGEKAAIEEVKKEYPHLRHRQIQGILQQKGLYLSFSSVYHHLKSINMVEPYERRPSPLKEPRYAIWQRNLMWGCDWTRLLINHLRWYLLVLIDFFSRYVIAYGIFPSISASHVRHIYSMGLKEQGIRKGYDILPELRVDRGSPNTSLVTREFFEIIGADLSFARRTHGVRSFIIRLSCIPTRSLLSSLNGPSAPHRIPRCPLPRHLPRQRTAEDIQRRYGQDLFS